MGFFLLEKIPKDCPRTWIGVKWTKSLTDDPRISLDLGQIADYLVLLILQ